MRDGDGGGNGEDGGVDERFSTTAPWHTCVEIIQIHLIGLKNIF